MAENNFGIYMGSYAVPTPRGTTPDPFALAAAGIALGLNGSEITEFLAKLNTINPERLSPTSAYAIMVEVAYQIRLKREGD